MVAVTQGDVWWVDLGEPVGSAPGLRRPVVVVQGNALNRSRLATVVCVALTSNLKWADAPGNVVLTTRMTGLPTDSIVNVSQMLTVDKSTLQERIGRIPDRAIALVLNGIDVVLGR